MIICFAESQTTNKKSLKRDFATFLQKLDSIQANQQKQGDEIRAIRQKLSDDDSSTRTDGENVLRLPQCSVSLKKWKIETWFNLKKI